jgi:hypothetical protein
MLFVLGDNNITEMIKKTIKQIKTSQAQAQKTADHLNQEVIVVAQNKQHIL